MSQPGEIVFPEKKTRPAGKGTAKTNFPVSDESANRMMALEDLLGDGWENLMSWKHNPWHRQPRFSGSNFLSIAASKDPAVQAKVKDIRRRADFWIQRLGERYPELAVKPHPVADERNGFLKWIEFIDRLVEVKQTPYPTLGLTQAFNGYLEGREPWDAAAARGWLAENAAFMDEVRAIALLPDASSDGISVERYSYFHARLAKECTTALMMEARLAAEDGDAAAAMDAVRYARGLVSQFESTGDTPLLQNTMEMQLQLDIGSRVLSEILPALPEGSRDPAAWEALVRPTDRPPSDFTKAMRGEWSNSLRYWILPGILDPDETRTLPDPGAFIDAYTLPIAELARDRQTAAPGDPVPPQHDAASLSAGLSGPSRQLMEMFWMGTTAWHDNWYRANTASGFTAAAFSLMKDDSRVPVDPVRGLPYRWDPATRTLSMPATPEFDGMKIKPVVVPRR